MLSPIKINILIDNGGHARLADFSLMTILSDPSNVLTVSSNNSGSTNRWMSPELVEPRHFGFEKTYHTKSSDCYAFGMVIYEVISGNPPFYEDGNFSVYRMVLSGEHPSRGTAFPDHL